MNPPMPEPRAGPWSPRDATDRIRAIARCRDLDLSYKLHARERLGERGLIISDVLYVLKFGFVYDPPEPATRQGYHRYLVRSKSPNSGGRDLGVVVIPDQKGRLLKIVTVMWIDEPHTRSGTIIGGEHD